MGCCYERLKFEEREEISRMLAKEMGIREIARQLGRDASTISREIGGDRVKRYYRAIKADQDARRNVRRRRKGKRKLLLNSKLAEIVWTKMRLRWSPEQIAEWLKLEYAEKAMKASAETIYTYLYILPRGELRRELLRCLRQRRRRRGVSRGGWTCRLEGMLSIEERPQEVADRSVPGHWEGDLLVGGGSLQTALGTLVERTTRTTLLVPLKGKSAKEVRKAFASEICKLPQEMRLSLTYDQGREMAEHKLFTKQTKMKVYFAHPRSPWERGTNENTNGLIRQFFPKGMDFRTVTKREIKHVQHLLNGRPRKSLNWKTPYEAMQQLLR